MRPTRGDGMVPTGEAARMVGVDPSTISKWRDRGWITPDGLDERNRPLYRRETVRAAEATVRANGLRTSRIDPRTQRKHARAAA